MAREIDQHLAINCFPLGIGPDHVTVQGSEPPFPFLEQKGKVGGGSPVVPLGKQDAEAVFPDEPDSSYPDGNELGFVQG